MAHRRALVVSRLTLFFNRALTIQSELRVEVTTSEPFTRHMNLFLIRTLTIFRHRFAPANKSLKELHLNLC